MTAEGGGPGSQAVSRGRHPAAAPASRVRFAHPSERVFAAILDACGITWRYEPVEFPLRWDARGRPLAGFRPDFYLPDQGCFVELTTADQKLVTRKNGKVRRLRQLYPEIEVVVVYQRDFAALVESHGLAGGHSAA